MKVRNKQSPAKRAVSAKKKSQLGGKVKARRKQGRNSRTTRKPRNRTVSVHRFSNRLSPGHAESEIGDTSTNSQRRKSQNEKGMNSAEQQDCTPVKLKKKNRKKLRASFIRHRKLIEKAAAEGSSSTVTSSSSLLLKRSSLRIRAQSDTMTTLQETTPADTKSIENISDCVLIEEVPEIIVIEDEDDNDENKISNEANELLDQVLKTCESMIDCPITDDSVTADWKNLSALSLESGELSASRTADNTIVEVDRDNENNMNDNKSQGDNLSMFYEDITASFVTQNDVPEYEEPSVQNRSVLSDDVEYVSSTVLTKKQRKRRKKKMQMQSQDDSVIFVSEEIAPKKSPVINTSDFIPLDNKNDKYSNEKQLSEARLKRTKNPEGFLERLAQPFKKFKENLGLSYFSDPETPPGKAIQNDIAFTTTERKRNAIYNNNTYNPNKETKKPGKRMVIVDGSNVAFAHSCNKGFSVKGIEIALQYFEKMGHEAKAVVPQHRLQRTRSSDPELLESLHRDGKIVFTPCKNLPGKSTSSYDDRFILQLAVEFDAAVVSNDNYRDLLNENPAFKKVIETRVIGYTWCKDMFMLPKDPYGRSGPGLSVILNRT